MKIKEDIKHQQHVTVDMDPEKEPDLVDLSRMIQLLVQEAEKHMNLDAVPQHLQALWDEIQDLKNTVQLGANLEVNFSILNGRDLENAVKVVRRASNIVDGLRRELVKTFSIYAEPEKAIAKVTETDCEPYTESLMECRGILARAIGFLQIESIRRLATCMQDSETLRHFQYMNGLLGGNVGLACELKQEGESALNSGGWMGTGRALVEKSSRRRQTAGGTSFWRSSRVIPERPCPQGCKCACHEVAHKEFPSQFRQKFKRLFPRFADSPVAFPRKAYELSVVSRAWKLKVQVHSYPVVPETSDVIQFAQTGSVEGLKMLKDSGRATLREMAEDGWTLLHYAAYYSHRDVVDYLLKNGAQRNLPEDKLRKASHFAKFRALTKGASELEKSVANMFDDAEDFSCDFGLSPVLTALLQQYDSGDTERPPLMDIIRFAKKAIEAPPDCDWNAWSQNLRASQGSPLFQELISRFHRTLPTRQAREKVFSDLLNGPDDLQHWTPLHWAAYIDCKPGFSTLIQYKANYTSYTPSRRNIIHQAAESGTQDVLQFILENGLHRNDIDINLQDYWNETPLHVAAGRSAASVDLLLAHGANAWLKQLQGQVPLHYTRFLRGEEQVDCVVSFLETANPPVDVRDVEGKPPLFYLLNSAECVRRFLDHNADISIVDANGRTILHHACEQDRPDVLELLLPRIQERLVEHQDKEGETPLGTCFRLHRVNCARILLRVSTPSQVIDKDGKTILQHAVDMGDSVILNKALAISDRHCG
ncbi:ankyrin [Aspergillus udagawae]|nr:ankyrin [Aspergillus udagawae]